MAMSDASSAAQTVEAIRQRFANADAFIQNYVGDREQSALFTDAKFLLAELDRVAANARRKALTEAWQAVDRAIRPLGYGGGATNSPWNQGYEQAKNEALNVILELRDRA